ncbi:histidinol-phosphate transaminase [Armatimonas rosea]|uniref:Histidinol-phosphate aminotransferase n=1 Tax=Armatimonas rosea TaxID=685828 RepID=A0A7W9W934_ARMRO|nr:histidinol-phosphate aminotransferase [Armatimonas rosea]
MNPERLAVSDRISRLIPYQPGKPIDEVKRELGIVGDVIKLASNENPLGPSPAGIAALQTVLPTLALYPDGACHTLRLAVAKKHGVSPDSLIFGNGSDEVIHLLGLTFLEPGDEIIVGDPTFVLYEAAATLAGATTVKVPLTPGDLRHDAAAMAAACTEKTRLVFVANPHNPTGSVISKADVETLLAALPPRAFLVLDEAYAEYVEDDPSLPRALDYLAAGAPVICLRTFSKLYGLAGFRVGYAVAAPDVIALLNQGRSPFNVNLAGQVAATAALTDTEFIARSKQNNDEGIAQLIAGFQRLGLSWVPTRANFIVVDTGRPAKAMFDALLKQGIIVRAFPKDLPTHLRVTIGTPEQNARFLEALEACLS